jgi:formiminotetrahydrofolate cyclodeaminase
MSTPDSPAKLVYQPVLGFVEQIAAKSAAPGGGSAAALSGAVGSSLLTMVINFTVGKKDYATVTDRFVELRSKMEAIRSSLTKCIDDDTDAFNRFRVARKLPERDDNERKTKDEALIQAVKDTVDVPYRTMNLCLAAIEIAPEIARDGNVNTVSDAGTGAEMLLAGLEGASLNILINLPSLEESEQAEWRRKVDSARITGRKHLEAVRAILVRKLNA